MGQRICVSTECCIVYCLLVPDGMYHAAKIMHTLISFGRLFSELPVAKLGLWPLHEYIRNIVWSSAGVST